MNPNETIVQQNKNKESPRQFSLRTTMVKEFERLNNQYQDLNKIFWNKCGWLQHLLRKNKSLFHPSRM